MSDEINKAEDNLLRNIEKNKEEEKKIILEKGKENKIIKFIKYFFYLSIFISGVLIIIKRYPYINSLYQNPVVLRNGTYNTDNLTNEYIYNMWRLMADKNLEPKCPLSGKEYIVKDKIIVCPNPQLHGFLKIVSEKGKTPEVRWKMDLPL